MKIKFIKKYVAFHDFEGAFGTSTIYEVGTIKNVSTKPAQWLIDNGFAEEVNESTWWKPKYGEKYFYIAHDGVVYPCTWKNDELDNGRLELGFVFKTEEAGIRCRDYLKAIATVRQDKSVVLTPKQARDSDYVFYIENGETDFIEVRGVKTEVECLPAGAILFGAREHAQASLNIHKNEWEIIANYDWSRE